MSRIRRSAFLNVDAMTPEQTIEYTNTADRFSGFDFKTVADNYALLGDNVKSGTVSRAFAQAVVDVAHRMEDEDACLW